MGRKRVGRVVVLVSMLVAGLSVLPEAASAVLSGENGRIVIASGRGEASDATARLFLRPVISSTGGGTAGPTITPGAGLGQHRHPTWSPDRTKIAYSRQGDIRILDLTAPGSTPQNITNSGANDDRPAWSPDGARIAYETDGTGAGQTDILVDTEPFGSPNLNLTNTTSAGQFEGKPAWTPNSAEIYYHTGDPNGANTMDIVKEPSGGGTVTNIATNPLASEFQPSVSPDGTQLCFTRGEGFNGSADVIVSLANGGGQTDVSDNIDPTSPPFDPEFGDYNCTWSPDGTLIAYVTGTFATGDLVIERADDTGTRIPIEETAARFDGNPDWAPDARPQCEDETVTTRINQPIQVPLLCADTGPEYERTPLRAIRNDAPANGTLSPEDAQEVPANVTYTPNQGFSGTDTFTIQSFDQFGFGDRNGTVTVNVEKQPNGFEVIGVTKNKKKGTAELTVSVDEGPGDIALASKKAKPVAAPVGAGENVELELRVKAKGKAKRKLKKKGKAKVNTALTYTPDLGDASSLDQKVKLKKKRK